MQLRVTLYPSPQVTAPRIWQFCNGVAQWTVGNPQQRWASAPRSHTSPAGGTAQPQSHIPRCSGLCELFGKYFPAFGWGNIFVKAKFFIIKTFVSAGLLGNQTHSSIYKHLCTSHQLFVLKLTLMDSCFSHTLDSH